jgi:hypothetical protein
MFALGIDRSEATRVFVYAMAAIPIVLGAFLFHVLFLGKTLSGEPVHHLLLNVAAAMLAVLPLRQVLVPQEITGLTRIDLVLGLGLVLIISLSLLRYATLIQRN